MHFIAIDNLEAAFAKVLLRGGGQQVELADAARSQPVEQLANDLPSDAEAPVVGMHCNRANQRRELVRLGAAATDDRVAVARDDEGLPVIVDARGRQIVVEQQLLDRGEVAGGRAGDSNIPLHASTSITKKGRAPRGLPLL